MKRIFIVGNGNWGTTIAKVIAENVTKSKLFENEVLLYVHDEIYENQKLSEIINQKHSNPIYLPGIKLPDNIKAVTDLSLADQSDIIIICIPHQFIGIIKDIKPKSGCFAINLSKGFIMEGNELLMPSEYISRILKIECCCLMGANIAAEVALEKLCECTIGFTQKMLKENV
jgi:glycerol-3-phosphate dehydrogenase (NAD+)